MTVLHLTYDEGGSMQAGADSEYELRLIVSGLCMFVPDEKGSVMHVLMPATGGHSGHGGHAHDGNGEIHVHHAVLAYSRALTTPGAQQVTDAYEVVQLDGNAITIDSKLGDALEATVDREKVVLLEPTKNFSGVDRACVQPEGSDRVTARAELRNGKASTYAPVDDQYCLGDTPHQTCQTMAEETVWIVGRFRGPLDLSSVIRVTPLNGASRSYEQSAPSRLPTLHPVNDADLGRPAITLRLMHAVPAALPEPGGELPRLSGGGNPDHFIAYYGLATAKTTSPLKPKKPDQVQPFLPGVMCMLSQGEFEP